MKHRPFLTSIQKAREQGTKLFALLLDPDKMEEGNLMGLIDSAERAGVDFLFVGGSLLTKGDLEECLLRLKEITRLPIIIFPGSGFHISEQADGILVLSLISGRNPDYLIGQHVQAAPRLKSSGIELIPTGYMLIDGGRTTSASYMSGTQSIPRDKPGIASCTAMAGEILGLSVLFMDAGSGAKLAVDPLMVKTVRDNTDIPIIVGGGLRSVDAVKAAYGAGADLVVLGTLFEEAPDELESFLKQVRQGNNLEKIM